MKKRTTIITEKREVWVIRPLPEETVEERREEADAAASGQSYIPDKVEGDVELSEEKK